jgi:response regulator RpfG family c-di-GMP phosphodiesterase
MNAVMSRPRILVADDDRGVRQLVGLTLPAADYDLHYAEDGEEAVSVAYALQPGLILLDLQMPGLDGLQVCLTLRADPRTAHTPIVMLTGYLNEEVQTQALRAGVNGILTKPFSPLALEQTIRSLLSSSEIASAGPIVISRGATAQARGGTVPTARETTVVAVTADNPTCAAGSATDDIVDLTPPSRRQATGQRLLSVAQRRNADLNETFVSTIEALSTALELRTTETEGHAQRVSLYTVTAARSLGVGGRELEQMHWGALLHDVGKIGIPDAILLKADPLRPEEWALIRMHPDLGARLLQGVPGLGPALEIVRLHHERFDGAGYPLGLRGTAIPLGARIFAVADAIDAITSDRPYRPGRSWEQARIEILQSRGTHFDPSVVDAFLEILDDLRGLTAAQQPFPSQI